VVPKPYPAFIDMAPRAVLAVAAASLLAVMPVFVLSSPQQPASVSSSLTSTDSTTFLASGGTVVGNVVMRPMEARDSWCEGRGRRGRGVNVFWGGGKEGRER